MLALARRERKERDSDADYGWPHEAIRIGELGS
jgi:hypothetical protein